MHLVSFNINSVRARRHQLDAVLGSYGPCILGLQETKVADADFPYEWLHERGYCVEAFGDKGHYGVAIASNQPAVHVQRGFPWDPEAEQKRFIVADFVLDALAGPPLALRVVNAYYPQGESRDHPTKFEAKRHFFAEMLRYLQEYCDPAQPLALLGDFNVAPAAADVGISERDRQRWLDTGACSFLPEERSWFDALLQWGLHDVYQAMTTSSRRFSWFDYRRFGFDRDPKRGLRLDHALLTQPLVALARACDIDYDIRAMPKPSDHAPVWVRLGHAD